MTARAIWKGVIRFADTELPVKLYSAVEDRKVHFRRAKRLVASSGESSTIEIDGEPLGQLPLEITIVPDAVRIIV